MAKYNLKQLTNTRNKSAIVKTVVKSFVRFCIPSLQRNPLKVLCGPDCDGL